MATNGLHQFIAAHRDDIIWRCRGKVAKRSNSRLITTEINHGVPEFLDQLVIVLRLGLTTNPEIGRTALLHGYDLLLQGFSVSEVVHDYGDICQSVTELADELGTTISAADFRIFNRCLDDAIAGAVTEYGRVRPRETVAAERVDGVAHKVRGLSQTALLAFEVLKSGSVGVGGSTGTVLHRSLTGIDTLVKSWLTDDSTSIR